MPPPELVPRLPFGPGESQERLVIRSTPGQSAADYAAASQAAADPCCASTDFCDRHVAAAKASLQLVETHGLLDEAIDAVRGLDPVAAAAAAQPFYDIASRESGSFRDTPGAPSCRPACTMTCRRVTSAWTRTRWICPTCRTRWGRARWP